MPKPTLPPTSRRLSDGRYFPYFLRTVPNDVFQTLAMVDLLKYLFDYSHVALFTSNSAYGSAGASAFESAAETYGLNLLTTQRFVENTLDFSSIYESLAASRARVVALICMSADAANFMVGAYRNGLAGPGYLYLATDGATEQGLWAEHPELSTNVTLRLHVLKGFFGVSIHAGVESNPRDPLMTLQAYRARRRRALPTVGSDESCSVERDDDQHLLWALDHDENTSTPLRCSRYVASGESSYEAYAYDAVYAVARALHSLIEVHNRTSIRGSELLAELIQDTHFWGVTGELKFHDVRLRSSNTNPLAVQIAARTNSEHFSSFCTGRKRSISMGGG